MKESYALQTGDEYAERLLAFREVSDEHEQVAKAIEPIIKDFEGRPVELLSIGAGTGKFEELLVQKHGLKLKHFHAMEPNETEREGLKVVMDRLKVENTIDPRFFDENTDFEKKFDLVLFVHTLYHISNPAEMVRRSRSFLKPNGKVIVVVQGKNGFVKVVVQMLEKLNFRGSELTACAPLVFQDICEYLDQMNVPYEVTETVTHADVSDFINNRAPEIVSFFIQTDFKKLSEEDAEMIYNFIKKESVHNDGKHTIIDSNGVIVVGC